MKLGYVTRFQLTDYFYKLKLSTYKLQNKVEEIRTKSKNVLQKLIAPSSFCLLSNIFANNGELQTYFDSLVFIFFNIFLLGLGEFKIFYLGKSVLLQLSKSSESLL